MVYKIMTKKVSLDSTKFFVRSTRNRFNRFQLHKRRHTSKTENNFFTRTVNAWNQLPDKIVSASSTKSFTKQLKELNLFDPYQVT